MFLCSRVINRPDWRAVRRAWEHFMVMTVAAFIMAQVAMPTSSPCETLLTSFAKNEVAFTIIDDMNQSVLKADMDYAKSTGNWSGIEDRLVKINISQEKFTKEGDRIIPLLLGHGCPLPDHVASPVTFRAEMQTCDEAKGTPNEAVACNFVARAVAATMARQKQPTTHAKRNKR